MSRILPLLLALAAAPALSAPAQDKDLAVGFLSKFGYIDLGSGEALELKTGGRLSEEKLSAALREVQRFGHIPQTGVLDRQTLQLMSSRRCGLPDVVRGATEIFEEEEDLPEVADDEHYNETPFQGSSHHFHYNHSHPHHHHHHHHHHQRGGELSRLKEEGGKARRKRYILASRGWQKRNLQYYLDNEPAGLGRAEALAAVQAALGDWARYSGLVFRQARAPAEADISFGFYHREHGDGNGFDGRGGVLAHAFFPGSDVKIQGDVHFDAEEVWKIDPPPQDYGVDLYMVALHELGHSLGLSHSPEEDSVMFPYYRRSQRGLGGDDIRAMYQLYVRKRFEDDPVEGSRQPPQPRRPENRPPPEQPRRPEKRPPPEQPRRPENRPPPEQPRRPENRPPPRRADPTPPTGEGSWGGPRTQAGCRGHFDVVALIRSELFIFKEKLMWRLRGPGQVQKGYPVDFHRFFYDLPKELKRIDAIYQREHDSKIIIFSGPKYWVYDGTRMDRPRSIRDYGLPSHVTKVDAATSRNNTAILFTDYKYWMFDERRGMLTEDSPRPVQDWGLDRPIDAALTYRGETYFFKEDSFWVYDDRSRSLRQHHSRARASEYWLNC